MLTRSAHFKKNFEHVRKEQNNVWFECHNFEPGGQFDPVCAVVKFQHVFKTTVYNKRKSFISRKGTVSVTLHTQRCSRPVHNHNINLETYI